MKSQRAGSLFRALVIAVSSSTVLSLAGLEVPYLSMPSAYAVSGQTLEAANSDSVADATASLGHIQVARRFRAVSR